MLPGDLIKLPLSSIRNILHLWRNWVKLLLHLLLVHRVSNSTTDHMVTVLDRQWQLLLPNWLLEWEQMVVLFHLGASALIGKVAVHALYDS